MSTESILVACSCLLLALAFSTCSLLFVICYCFSFQWSITGIITCQGQEFLVCCIDDIDPKLALSFFSIVPLLFQMNEPSRLRRCRRVAQFAARRTIQQATLNIGTATEVALLIEMAIADDVSTRIVGMLLGYI